MSPAAMAVQQVKIGKLIIYFLQLFLINFFFLYVNQAAAVAARLAQSVGNTVTEDIKVPDKISALLSARTGSDDPLSRLQAESGCKIQMSRETGIN